MSSDSEYLRIVGANILGAANDLKRTPEKLAAELGWNFTKVQSVIDGKSDTVTAQGLMLAIVNLYPIPLSELWIDRDDTDDGARIMASADSQLTGRVFEREDGAGGLSPYYEYRDTAMSRTAQLKPEWIKELRVVNDAEPNNLAVAYNHGHMLHQTTLFVGPVNFYWELNGKRYCVEMMTGDSNYITPFVSHSFASRNANELGLIIAVTYGGLVSRSKVEFARLGVEATERIAADPRNPDTAFTTSLARIAEADSLTVSQTIDLLVDGGIDRSRAETLCSKGRASSDEIAAIAEIMGVGTGDLSVTPLLEAEEVVVKRRSATEVRYFPHEDAPVYELREMARTRHQPLLRGFELTVLGTQPGGMQHTLHEYIYNFGNIPVLFNWGDRETTIDAGGSAYVQPGIRHSFRLLEKGAPAHLCVVRIPGELTHSAIQEYSVFSPQGRERVAGETTQWF
jgi:hypothetical protein